MPHATDARGREVCLSAPPRRIVSLVPSTTETLFALGLGERVVGVTRFCVHPAALLKDRVKVGGTKDLELARLEALDPDLVVGNVEENTPAMFEEIEARWPLYAAMPRTVDEALADLEGMGGLLGAGEAAASHRARIEAARARLREAAAGRRWGFTYLIWRRPWMAASGDTFISAMLSEAGGVNAFADHPRRYFELSPEEMRGLALLSSEPFPFADKHRRELAEAGIPLERSALIDGEYCSWHGVRMAAAFDYLRGLLERGALR
jgi:iron complex transport system substrate-binding protein